MALNSPYTISDFAALLRFAKVSFRLKDSQIISGLGDGQVLGATLAPSLWMADVTLAKFGHREAQQIQARIEALNGPIGTFHLFNPVAQYPQGDPTGSILGASTVQISSLNGNNKAMRLKGLPVGYRLTVGDMLSYTYASTRKALLRIVETPTPSGGTVSNEFEVWPRIPVGSAVNDAVQLVRPFAKFFMMPDSLNVETDDNLITTSIAFTAMQRVP